MCTDHGLKWLGTLAILVFQNVLIFFLTKCLFPPSLPSLAFVISLWGQWHRYPVGDETLVLIFLSVSDFLGEQENPLCQIVLQGGQVSLHLQHLLEYLMNSCKPFGFTNTRNWCILDHILIPLSLKGHIIKSLFYQSSFNSIFFWLTLNMVWQYFFQIYFIFYIGCLKNILCISVLMWLSSVSTTRLFSPRLVCRKENLLCVLDPLRIQTKNKTKFSKTST